MNTNSQRVLSTVLFLSVSVLSITAYAEVLTLKQIKNVGRVTRGLNAIATVTDRTYQTPVGEPIGFKRTVTSPIHQVPQFGPMGPSVIVEVNKFGLLGRLGFKDRVSLGYAQYRLHGGNDVVVQPANVVPKLTMRGLIATMKGNGNKERIKGNEGFINWWKSTGAAHLGFDPNIDLANYPGVSTVDIHP